MTEDAVDARLKHVDAPAHVALLCSLWLGYKAGRALTGNTSGAALSNAARLLEVESALGLNIEQTVQSAVGTPGVFVAANTYYLLHFPLTLAVMALAFWQHRSSVFPVFRNSLIGATAAALVLHIIVPMAPPRMLPGFIDATVAYGPDPYAIPGSGAVNQFAAMPSMHVGWAILTGYAIWKTSNGVALKGVATLHPIVTVVVVIITGHHFVSDALVGAALAATFLILSIRLVRATKADTSEPKPPGTAPSVPVDCQWKRYEPHL